MLAVIDDRGKTIAAPNGIDGLSRRGIGAGERRGIGRVSVLFRKVQVCRSAGFATPRVGCRRWGCLWCTGAESSAGGWSAG